jgi:hypothetical protein
MFYAMLTKLAGARDVILTFGYHRPTTSRADLRTGEERRDKSKAGIVATCVVWSKVSLNSVS